MSETEEESDYGEEEVEDGDYESRSPSPNYSDEDDVEEDEDLPHLDGYLDGSGISICHFPVFFRTTKIRFLLSSTENQGVFHTNRKFSNA